MSCSTCGHDRGAHDAFEGPCRHEVWDDGQWLEESCDCHGYTERSRDFYISGADSGEMPLSGFEGTFSVSVWPVYIGCSMEGSTPPFTISEPHNGGYQRGTILWTPVPDARQVIGRARILLPPGTFTHFVYFHHPVSGACCGVAKMDFPLTCTEPLTYLDVDPILNNDLALLQERG